MQCTSVGRIERKHILGSPTEVAIFLAGVTKCVLPTARTQLNPAPAAPDAGIPPDDAVIKVSEAQASGKHILLTEQKNLKNSKKYLMNIFQYPLY